MLQTEPRIAARQLARDCLKESGYSFTGGQPVRLLPLRRTMRIAKVRHLPDLSSREGAILPTSGQISLWQDDAANLLVGGSGISSRFTYAHELAHWAAKLRLPEEVRALWTRDQIRQFCDEFAGRLLVPNDLLLAKLRAASLDLVSPFQLTITLIETLHRQIRVPQATLVKRLDDATTEDHIRITNCAMVVCAGRSAKRGAHYAPRILACCTPSEWFLPANKRLITIGMRNLEQAFWKAPALQAGFAVDQFTIWLRDRWRESTVTRPVEYRIYEVPKSVQTNRAMLALFPGPR